MKITEKFSKKQILLGIIGSVILVLLLVYIGLAIYFNSHFQFRTQVNGVNASGRSISKVEKAIGSEIDGYKIVLEEKDNKTETLKGSDIDLAPLFDGSLQKELKRRNGFTWPISLFKSTEIEVETMVEYDKDKLENQILALKCMDEASAKAPENASVSQYSPDKGYEIVPSKPGNTIDREKFQKVLSHGILNLQKTVSLEEKECYLLPAVTEDSEEIKSMVQVMNQYANAKITYEFGDKKETLDGTTISQWITVDENQIPQISQDKINEYMAGLAEKYNTAGKAKSLATSYGTTISVSGGDYGWKIDREAEAAALLASIQAGETVSKEPAYSKSANSHGANDYGSTYVEINLTAQHLFYYKNGALILESDLVSGNEAKDYHTPAGAYGLYYKQRDKTLRGEDYATPVSYWMPFNGGVGLHDAGWRNDFGGNYYRTSGSHGCVNLPAGVAKKLYDSIDAGCAILVYKLPGTESGKSQSQDAAAAVVSAIKSLGDITSGSRGAVASARAQYDALNDTGKGFVTNYNVLVAAEQKIAELDAQAAQAEADSAAQAQAQPVIDAINTLANIQITPDMKPRIEQIRAQYNGLSEAAKSKVGNYYILTAAEAAVA